MYLYNVSIIIEDHEFSLFYPWLQNFIKEVKSDSVTFLRLTDSPHEGHTYCIHLKTDTRESIDRFKTDYIVPLQEYITAKHNEKIFLFDSLMEYIAIGQEN